MVEKAGLSGTRSFAVVILASTITVLLISSFAFAAELTINVKNQNGKTTSPATDTSEVAVYNSNLTKTGTAKKSTITFIIPGGTYTVEAYSPKTQPPFSGLNEFWVSESVTIDCLFVVCSNKTITVWRNRPYASGGGVNFFNDSNNAQLTASSSISPGTQVRAEITLDLLRKFIFEVRDYR